MRFDTNQHRFYCGLALHARTMSVCILSHDGALLVHRNMPAAPEPSPRPLLPTGRVLASRSNACFPGTGLPISALPKKSPVAWAMRSP